MADVFISYKKEDRALAEMLEKALIARQLTVWWDKELKGGQEFRREIKDRLDEAGAVVVIWSPRSVLSDFVCAEANAGKKAGKLVPVMFQYVEPPFPFGETQSHSLEGWSGDHMDPRIESLVGQIDAARRGRVGAAAAQVGAVMADAVARRAANTQVAKTLVHSLQFLAFFGLPLYRLMVGALVVAALVTAIWFAPAAIQGAFGPGPLVFALSFVCVLAARAMYQVAMIMSGKYSRQFFDGPFSFWTVAAVIGAVVGVALMMPMGSLTLVTILEAAPIYFSGVLLLFMGLRLVGAAFGKLLAKA
jgi:hypothetical protein